MIEGNEDKDREIEELNEAKSRMEEEVRGFYIETESIKREENNRGNEY